ncbi:MAG: hypothetical protein QHH75_10950 [Bacillota bacterium]|jgi:hypothetical protein|nr:hypothetical protein [Bacillota bacterium]
MQLQLCEEDNFQKTPPGPRSYAFLLPLALENLESSPEYAKFCRLLLTEQRFNEVFPPAERGEAGNLVFPKEYLLSIAWRYLNQTGTPALRSEVLGEILAQSEAVWDKKSFNFRMVAPLVGLSGSGEHEKKHKKPAVCFCAKRQLLRRRVFRVALKSRFTLLVVFIS